VKRFEKTVLGLISGSCIFLFIIAVDRSQGKVYKSPEANFVELMATSSIVPSNLSGQIKDIDPNGNKHLTVKILSKRFTVLDYDFDNILDQGAAVPRILVVNIPRDIRKIRIPADRKLVFFKTILPLILEGNKHILRDRKRLLRIKTEREIVGAVSVVDRLWLSALSDSYDVDPDNISEMLRRVDIIPPSIALAQAAEESGWGTSRFAIEGNALFGQYTFETKHSLVPLHRDKGKDHKIRVFPSLLDAVKSYAHNLNTHKAYRKFRSMREDLRLREHEITGNKLVGALTSYSERGHKYVRTIRLIMNLNRLKNLDKAKVQKDFVAYENIPAN
jgi:Bax protein